jgi:hypothetical protein
MALIGRLPRALRSRNLDRAIHKDLQDERKVARGLEP